MKCAYHPDREAVGECTSCQKPLCGDCEVTCNKCGLTFCQEHVESIGGKTLCRVCALPIKQKEGLNWFQRHLNWTFVLVLIPIYLIVFTYVVVMGSAMKVGVSCLITGALMIPLGLWILRQKHRKWWQVLYLLIPYFAGWVVFLGLGNRPKEMKPVNQGFHSSQNNSMVRDMWERALGEEGLSVASGDELSKIIEGLIVADNINPLSFCSNYEALVLGVAPSIGGLTGTEKGKQPTPSLSYFRAPQDRPPAFPLWFIAAYPDVVLWYENKSEEYMRVRDEDGLLLFSSKAFGIDPTAPNLKEEDLMDSEGKSRPNTLRKLVQFYRENTGEELETGVKSLAEDIYLGSELLETLGVDNNYVLIAENTTKYYLELSANYKNRFNTEASLLATAGVLDAQNYIFIDNPQIEVSKLLDYADRAVSRAADKQSALVYFITYLEIEIFAIESPELDYHDIVTTATDTQVQDAIGNAVRNTMKKYMGERMFALATANLMESPQFEAIRNQLGIKEMEREIPSD